MGREVRMVPPGWEHPRAEQGHHIPLRQGFTKALSDWEEGNANWGRGLRLHYGKYPEGEWLPLDGTESATYEGWAGARPLPGKYMPDFPEGTATHYMMYEDVTEGTPISPAFATPEELARWLANNGASAFGSMTATYDQWLAMIGVGWAPSGAYSPETGLISGVEAETALPSREKAGDPRPLAAAVEV